ncbi:MAG: ion channel [Verrucomicrobiota bacterium]
MTYLQFRERYIFWGLLISLLLAFTFTPFLHESVRTLNIFILSSLVFAVGAIAKTRKRLLLGMALGVPSFAVSIVAINLGHKFLLSLHYSLSTVFFGFVIIILLYDIFIHKRVDTNQLLAAISIYLCIGVVWAMLFGLVNLYEPNSYSMAGSASADIDTSSLLYFSIVTLTTLGYGDITPLSAPARSLAAMEALVGQIYLTVLVARLVGLHIAGESNSSK